MDCDEIYLQNYQKWSRRSRVARIRSQTLRHRYATIAAAHNVSPVANKMPSMRDVVIAYYYYKKKKKERKYWVTPYISNNINRGAFVCAKELGYDEDKFKSFYRMSKESFRLLVQFVRPEIMKQDTHYRCCITVEERLLITLR